MDVRRARGMATAACGLAASGVLAAACVLLEGPGEPLVPVKHRPVILHQNVVPKTTQILESWPDTFTVPVEVFDPNDVVEWRAFVDYDRTGTAAFVGQSLGPDPASDDAGVRSFGVNVPQPADMTACHTIEVVVALQFFDSHTPEPPGGDNVTWFYAPSGSLDDCPIYDAGPSDGGVDAADGGDGALE